MLRLGIDSGGTFTDFVLLAGERLVTHKVRSTPDNPAVAILSGLGEILALGDVGPHPAAADGDPQLEVVHGTTVATNALLERTGARVALVTTRGFEDTLSIGRQTRRELYNFFVEDRRPLVEPGLVFGVAERISAEGVVLEALPARAAADLVAALRSSPAESVAICLLHSYANSAHERALGEALEAAGFYVSVSHRVLPEYREFERASTTAVNAFVTPLTSRYLQTLEAGLGAARLRIMQSNGGSISSSRAREAAVQTILSGPAAGAVGALAVARASGFPRAISFDMGGTSTDVSLLDDGIGTTLESEIGGFPVRLPIIDIHTVGAGGGSVAYVDGGGALRVGPRSAGADPGPACYGRGDDVTVTDANLMLGRLDPDYFLGGRMSLDLERARTAVRSLGAQLGLEETALAEGIVRVANANMERAIRVVSVQRGYDPRGFALVAFGGAGGMHACETAAALNIGTVVVPRHAGVLSALGALVADVTRDYSQTVLRAADGTSDPDLATAFAPLVEQAWQDLRDEGFEPGRVAIDRFIDVRYTGQSYEIAVPYLDEGGAVRARLEFDRHHERLYGYAAPQRRAEFVNVRVRAVGRTEKPPLPRQPPLVSRLPDPVAVRRAWFSAKALPVPCFHRDQLGAGMAGHGPTLVAGADATAVVPPGFEFRVDEVGSLIVTRVVQTRGRTRRPLRLAGERAA